MGASQIKAVSDMSCHDSLALYTILFEDHAKNIAQGVFLAFVPVLPPLPADTATYVSQPGRSPQGREDAGTAGKR